RARARASSASAASSTTSKRASPAVARARRRGGIREAPRGALARPSHRRGRGRHAARPGEGAGLPVVLRAPHPPRAAVGGTRPPHPVGQRWGPRGPLLFRLSTLLALIESWERPALTGSMPRRQARSLSSLAGTLALPRGGEHGARAARC